MDELDEQIRSTKTPAIFGYEWHDNGVGGSRLADDRGLVVAFIYGLIETGEANAFVADGTDKRFVGSFIGLANAKTAVERFIAGRVTVKRSWWRNLMGRMG